MKGIDWKDPTEATKAAEDKKNPNFKYDPAVVNTDKQTVSIHGTKTINVKPNAVARGGSAQATDQDKYMADLAKRFPGSSGEQLAEKGKEGSFISQSMIDKYNKKYYKPKTETHDIKESWDGLDLDLGDGEKIPPPEINVPVDPSGMDPDAVATDPVNTKLGDLDDKLEGRVSNLTKRKEQSTALNAEGFDSKGTPLKTRGIANKNWGLA